MHPKKLNVMVNAASDNLMLKIRNAKSIEPAMKALTMSDLRQRMNAYVNDLKEKLKS